MCGDIREIAFEYQKKKKKKTWTCSKKSEVLSCIVMMYNFIDMRSAKKKWNAEY